MQLPELTTDQVQEHCTEQSFARGVEYFHDGAIGNPVLHGYALSGTCEGTDIDPYRVTVELMPTGIAAARCSCPYSGEGDCKHIVAFLLTYIHAPDTILSVETLLAALAEKPKASLLQVISELLKRTPELALIAQAYSDIPIAPARSEPLPLVTVYREQVDRLFGDGFLEQHQLHQVLIQLEGLRRHAESLAKLNETELALSILHALIHQSIVRHSDTLQQSELPRFIEKCTEMFTEITTDRQEPVTIHEHCRMLLRLSFDAEPVFTPLLTGFLEQFCLMEEMSGLEVEIEQHLDESPDRGAHVRLLLAIYFESGRTEDYLRLAQSEGEGFRLIHYLFLLRRDDEGWTALKAFPLSVDEYWRLFQHPIARRVPRFTEKLFALLGHLQTDTAITLYQRLIDRTVLSRKHEDYKKVQVFLIELRALYQHLHQENQWSIYLTHFRKQHARKRLLLKIIAEVTFTEGDTQLI